MQLKIVWCKKVYCGHYENKTNIEIKTKYKVMYGYKNSLRNKKDLSESEKRNLFVNRNSLNGANYEFCYLTFVLMSLLFCIRSPFKK